MQYVIYKDNGGLFHWRLADSDGTALAVSATTFTTSDDARLAAADVHNRAASATAPSSATAP
jgi:uncharacterized protein YegP (UPF0339 family)